MISGKNLLLNNKIEYDMNDCKISKWPKRVGDCNQIAVPQ